MKLYKYLLPALLMCCVSALSAQSLQYFATLKISDSPVTIPAGQTWKVTGIYGEEYRYNECVDVSSSSTHELNRLRCMYSTSSYYLRTSYSITSMVVDGISIVSTISGLPANGTFGRYTSSDCTTGSVSSLSGWDGSCANKEADPNIFPVWLPAGSVIQSGGPNTFVSIVAFEIVP